VYQSLKNAVIKLYERFIKLKGARREIALGFALGLFIGMSPFFGMHIAISVVFASILGWSKIAAAVGVNITNVFTAPLIYPVTYLVGSKITGFTKHVNWPTSIDFTGFLQLVKESPVIILDLCVGGAILGLPIAIAGYYLSYNAITVYRQRVKEKMRELKRQRKLKAKAQKKNKRQKTKSKKPPASTVAPPPSPQENAAGQENR
jgi:uncharacterized protein (DUF2062 family)